MKRDRVTEDITCGWYVEGYMPDPETSGEGGIVQLSRIFYSLKTANEWADEARLCNERPDTVQVRTKFYRAKKGREQLFA